MLNNRSRVNRKSAGRPATPSPGSAKQSIRELHIYIKFTGDSFLSFFLFLFNKKGHNIDQAISACKRENSSLIRNPERMETVKEAMNDGYCDITNAVDLSLAGELYQPCQ
jgi:hypothetical protein